MTKVQIAPLRTGDAETIARLQDALWRATYSDLLPAWVLGERDEADNIARWRDRATAHEKAGRSSEGARTLVAHDEAGVPIGWASTGPPREVDPPTDTELRKVGFAPDGVSKRDPRLGAGQARVYRLIRRRKAIHTSRFFFEWFERADPRP